MPDPAPGPLRLVQSLANTLSADPQTDLLSTREEAAARATLAAVGRELVAAHQD